MLPTPQHTGWIETICGSMFSGKTEELIRRLRRAQIAKLRVEIFKPVIDSRYSKDHIVSHDDNRIPSQTIHHSAEIYHLAQDADVVGIDEVQFFDAQIVDVCQDLADAGKRVIASGLDQDYRGQPFDPMPHLLCISEYITKTLAICTVCGGPANRNQRLVKDREQVLIGSQNVYEARCRKCFQPPLRHPVSIPHHPKRHPSA